MLKGRRRAIFSKIYKRIEKVRGPLESPCWIWRGPCSGSGRGGGYGRFCLDGATYAVHRAMYEIWHGPIGNKKQIDHKCRNRRCCNPLHLEQVTHKQNQKRRDSDK